MGSPHTSGFNTVLLIVILLVGLTVGFTIGAAYASRQSASTGSVATTSSLRVTTTVQFSSQHELLEYCFSPGGSCSSIIIQWIARANSSIHILIYSFTLDDVRDALIQAKGRGIEVKIVMERSNANSSGSEYQTLKNAGIDIRLDTNSGEMHDKVAIIDAHIVITGSFNYSQAATNRNNENVIVIDSQSWTQAYEAQFQTIYNASTP